MEIAVFPASAPFLSELSLDERRGAARHSLAVKAPFFVGDETQARTAVLSDISSLGIGLLVDDPPELGALLEIDLRPASRGTLLPVLARVVHVEAEEKGRWRVGAAFVAELEDDLLAAFQAERRRSDGEDARRWVRFPCNVETVCWTSETAPGERRPARIVNVSPGGIALLLPCDFSQGTLLRFRPPAFPDRPDADLLVRVMRVAQHSHGWWFHGCEFVETIAEDDLKVLFR